MTKADRRDAKRRAKREDRVTGLAAYRYCGDPAKLAARKAASAAYRRAVKSIEAKRRSNRR